MDITSVNINWFSCSIGFVHLQVENKKHMISLGWNYSKGTNIYKKIQITILILLPFAAVFPILGNKNCTSKLL